MLRPYFFTLQVVSHRLEEEGGKGKYARRKILGGIDAPLEPASVSSTPKTPHLQSSAMPQSCARLLPARGRWGTYRIECIEYWN